MLSCLYSKLAIFHIASLSILEANSFGDQSQVCFRCGPLLTIVIFFHFPFLNNFCHALSYGFQLLHNQMRSLFDIFQPSWQFSDVMTSCVNFKQSFPTDQNRAIFSDRLRNVWLRPFTNLQSTTSESGTSSKSLHWNISRKVNLKQKR